MPKFTSARHVKTVRNAAHIFQSRRTLWQMLRETFSGRYKMSLMTMVVMILCIAYIIIPFDFVPDYFPVLGWIDDGLVFYLLVKRLSIETQRYNRHKAMERRSGH